MASVGPQSPATVAQEVQDGNAWSNDTNIFSSNNARAISSQDGGVTSQSSDFLIATNFDFSAIPDGSTINGVIVAVEGSISAGTQSVNLIGELVYDGLLIDGASLNVAEAWSTTDAPHTLGGAADLWGASVSITAAMVKHPTFGVRLRCVDTDAVAYDFRIDHVPMTVHYTVGGDPGPYPQVITVG